MCNSKIKTYIPKVFPPPSDNPVAPPNPGFEENSPPLVEVTGLLKSPVGFAVFPNKLFCVFKFNPPPIGAVAFCCG